MKTYIGEEDFMIQKQKEEFYISVITDHAILDYEDYYKLQGKLKEMQKQIEVYQELLNIVVNDGIEVGTIKNEEVLENEL